jgi:hypothetical protein
MDRRRFLPHTEAMEGRALLVSVNVTNLFGFQVNNNLNIPITSEQKELRIDRLPYYLEKILPGRFLPKAEIQQVQAGLFNMMSVIHRPPSKALDNYNLVLRRVVPTMSLRANDAGNLNQAFTAVLNSAKTPPYSTDTMQSALNQWVTQVDTASPQPSYLATNDYTLVLETALAIGRPMPPPILPKIAKNHGIQADAQHIKTPLHHPTLVGTYHFHTHMEIIDQQGDVVGSTKVRKNNDYRITITPSLAVGTYKFQIRAVDDLGHLSRVSRPFLIKVVPFRHHRVTTGEATPEGPLAKSK